MIQGRSEQRSSTMLSTARLRREGATIALLAPFDSLRPLFFDGDCLAVYCSLVAVLADDGLLIRRAC